MNYIKRNIVFFTISLIVLFICFSLFIKYNLQIDNVYIAATVDKQNRIKQSNKKNAIILVGGSGFAFGTNSKQIADSMHCNVINMGLHGGLGLNYILKQVSFFAEKTTIILAPEYFLAANGEIKIEAQANACNLAMEKFMPFSLSKKILYFVASIQLSANKFFYNYILKNKEKTIYNRTAFNKAGDIQSILIDSNYAYLKDGEQIKELEYTVEINLLKTFISEVERKNCKVYFMFPSIAKSAYNKNISSINKFEKLMRKNITCKIINKPSTFVFDDSFYFDTVYHLNKKGMQKRMPILINLIKKNIR